MIKEQYVWLIFVSCMLVVVACAPTGEKEGTLFNENSIREKLASLDANSDVLYGKEIFDHTKEAVPDNVGNELSCLSCHGDGGLNENSPMVGITERYPRVRSGEMTSLKERINGCFIRSMNGKELDEDSEEMNAMVKYFKYISDGIDTEEDIAWRMTNEMEDVPVPDVENGEELFVEKSCVECHGNNGEGTSDHTGPPLWGEDSFNAAAGMNKIEKAAGFIQNNMPKGKSGTLKDQEAADIAAFLLSHDRPEGDPDIVGNSHHNEDDTYIFDKRREEIRNGTFDWSILDSVKDE